MAMRWLQVWALLAASLSVSASGEKLQKKQSPDADNFPQVLHQLAGFLKGSTSAPATQDPPPTVGNQASSSDPDAFQKMLSQLAGALNSKTEAVQVPLRKKQDSSSQNLPPPAAQGQPPAPVEPANPPPPSPAEPIQKLAEAFGIVPQSVSPQLSPVQPVVPAAAVKKAAAAATQEKKVDTKDRAVEAHHLNPVRLLNKKKKHHGEAEEKDDDEDEEEDEDE